MKSILGLLVSLGLVFAIKTYSAPPSDEETLVALEKEWSKYSNFTQKDADYMKGVIGPQFITIFPQGVSSTVTPSTIEADFAKSRAENPDGKFVFEYSDIKAHVFGDTAVVTYNQKTTATGFK